MEVTKEQVQYLHPLVFRRLGQVGYQDPKEMTQKRREEVDTLARLEKLMREEMLSEKAGPQ